MIAFIVLINYWGALKYPPNADLSLRACEAISICTTTAGDCRTAFTMTSSISKPPIDERVDRLVRNYNGLFNYHKSNLSSRTPIRDLEEFPER